MKILNGSRKRIRSDHRRRLLAVSIHDLADHQLVDAAEAWQAVREMQELGYPKAWISLKIGQGGRSLQLGKVQCVKRNADAILALRGRVGHLRHDERVNQTVEDESRVTGRVARLLEADAPG
jgi:hypothetical protein